MKIRRAEKKDLTCLLELYRLLEGPYADVEELDREDVERRFQEILDDPNQQTLIAEMDGEVAGSVVLVIVPNLGHGGAPYAVVENVVVDEVWRGWGIGKALMEEAVERARLAGAYKLALCSNLEREEAHRFYLAAGMKQTHAGFEVAP